MKVREIQDILSAEIICGEEFLERDVFSACGSDMMSDVLAYVKEQAVLLSGLMNPQVVRTAEMMDMPRTKTMHCISIISAGRAHCGNDGYAVHCLRARQAP